MHNGENMLYLQNFSLKENKAKSYQKWIKENEKALAEHAPKGWRFRGAYFYVLGFGPYVGAHIWEITDYADFDTSRNHDDPVWLKLAEEGMAFGTPEPRQPKVCRLVLTAHLIPKDQCQFKAVKRRS